jgi:hypothetical protein
MTDLQLGSLRRPSLPRRGHGVAAIDAMAVLLSGRRYYFSAVGGGTTESERQAIAERDAVERGEKPWLAPPQSANRVGGNDVTRLPPWQRNIGIVFQNYALCPHMTVAQNIAFPPQQRGVERTGQCICRRFHRRNDILVGKGRHLPRPVGER